ncbi:MAG: sialate O-acetylesterase, partial [Bacteroidales bacterium]|nr:sialate O-acetylesterase [Bacteroidales bacterium]
MKKLFTIAVLCLCMTLNAANLKFSSMLGDNMVLQQNATVKIWGYASPGASVSVSTSWGASGSARANAKGEWVATVKTPAATFNPQTVRARSGSESVTASNVLIGEVWFCSGQSNMQMTLGGGMGTPVEGSLEEIALSGQYKGVRHISIRNTSALEPAFDVEGEWQVSNPNTSPRF